MLLLMCNIRIQDIESFNPEFHQAISTNKDTTKKNDVISEVAQKGYMLNDRVIKPALVIVVKNS